MMSKISIVFTSYNHREYLAEALDSLLKQTFTDFELIIVDDCSNDGSQEILSDYALKDSRIKLVLNKRNSGSYVYSTNQGALLATSPYILFAQCDDFADYTQLQKLYDVIAANPEVGVVFSASRLIDKNGILLGDDFSGREKAFKDLCANDTIILREQMSRFLLKSCVIPNLSAALIRREFFEKQGGLSDTFLVLADWDFWLKTSLECDFYYIRETLNNFRQHDTTIRASVKLKRQVEEVFCMYYDFFRRTKIDFWSSLRWKRQIANIWVGYAKYGLFFWLHSFFSLLVTSFKYDIIFPLIAVFEFAIFPFKLILRRLF